MCWEIFFYLDSIPNAVNNLDNLDYEDILLDDIETSESETNERNNSSSSQNRNCCCFIWILNWSWSSLLKSNSVQEVTKQHSTQNRYSTISINPDIKTSNLGLNESDDSSSSQVFIQDPAQNRNCCHFI